MTKASETAALTGLRAPTPAEHRAISGLLTARYNAAIRTGSHLANALTAAGVALLFMAGQLGLGALPFGLLAFAGVFLAVAGKNRDRAALQAFQNAAYRVLDGQVCELGSSSDRPGYMLVRFSSVHGQQLSIWFPVRQRGVALNTPLLLAVTDVLQPGGIIVKAFTPFMLAQPAEKQELR